MPTSWELKQELKALTFGHPRVAVSGLQKHQLEGIVSYWRVKSKELQPHMTLPPTRPGPTGPRPVPVEEKEADGISLQVPKPPAPRLNRPVYDDTHKKPDGRGRPKKVRVVAEAVAEEAPIVAPVVRTKSERAVYCTGGCSCPNCPSSKKH